MKFAGEKFTKCREQIIKQYGDNPAFLENPTFYNAENVFYLRETTRWDYIVKHASQNDIAVIIDKAMSDIETDNPSLAGALSKNLFSTLGADKNKMNAIEIFKELIGERLTPLIVKYDPYKDVFTTHPYRHIFNDNFERIFTDVIFDSIKFI